MAVSAPVVNVESPQGRVHLTLTLPTTGGPSTFTVTRRETVSGSVVNVRTLVAVPILGPTWDGYDYEAPIGIAVTFAVTVTYANKTTETSPDSAAVTWTTSDTWLKDLQRPERSVVVTVSAAPDLSFGIPQGVYTVMARRTPVVVSSVRSSARGSLTLATLTLADLTAVMDVLASGYPVLLQAPVDFGGQLYLAVGDVHLARPYRRGDKAPRLIEMAVTEVDAPTIPVTLTLFTYQSVLDVYLTYQAVLVGETTYYDLLTGPGITLAAA